MPSIKTRLSYQQAVLEAARLALVNAVQAIEEASAALSQPEPDEPEEL